MSNTIHDARQYIKFSLNEFVALIFTSFFASFALTFNDWGNEKFDASAGINSWMLMFMAVLIIMIVTIWICKVAAIRLGYTIVYRAHYVGLMFGMIITIASNGYLPVFLPGGFMLSQPERLRVGKLYGHYKGWHVGLIASTFPFVMLAWIMLLNPLYLATQSPFFLNLIIGVCLLALYACIPVPFIQKTTSGRMFDFFKYFNGCSFGLEVYLTSSIWYSILCIVILLFASLSILLTLLSVHVGFILYILSIPVMMFCLWAYNEFFRH